MTTPNIISRRISAKTKTHDNLTLTDHEEPIIVRIFDISHSGLSPDVDIKKLDKNLFAGIPSEKNEKRV